MGLGQQIGLAIIAGSEGSSEVSHTRNNKSLAVWRIL